MKKIRILPFGYKIENGGVVLHEREAPVVSMIFSKYAAGAALSSIAEDLNSLGVPYSEASAVWNKSHIKRVLDDSRYINSEEFPALIGSTEFEAVSQIKAEKYNKKNITAVSSEIESIRKRAYCEVCGSKYKRRYDSRCGEKWYCSNKECHNKLKTTDDILKSSIIDILNQIIDNPSILRRQQNTGCGDSLKIMRMKNEFRRELNRNEIDIKSAKALLLSIAAEQYQLCRINSSAQDEILQTAFNIPEMTEFNTEVFTMTVEKALITDQGRVEVLLINGQIVSKSRGSVKKPITAERGA